MKPGAANVSSRHPHRPESPSGLRRRLSLPVFFVPSLSRDSRPPPRGERSRTITVQRAGQSRIGPTRSRPVPASWTTPRTPRRLARVETRGAAGPTRGSLVVESRRDSGRHLVRKLENSLSSWASFRREAVDPVHVMRPLSLGSWHDAHEGASGINVAHAKASLARDGERRRAGSPTECARARVRWGVGGAAKSSMGVSR